MFEVKVLLATAAICSALLAVLMIWNMEVLSCDVIITKILITIFVVSSIILTKDVAKL